MYLSICKLENLTILRDFFIFQSWQHQKCNNSAWLPHFSMLTTSKTKQFCESSSFFEVDNIKNEAILRHVFIFWTRQHPKQSNSARLIQFLNLTTSKTKQFCETSFKNRKLSAALTASYQCVLRFFHSTCLKYCACHEKLIRSAAPVTQNHLSKLTDLMLQNATPLRNSAPWPPNISDEHVFCTAPGTRNASLQILFKCPTPAIVLEMLQNPASRHNGVHFFDIATSKSGSKLVCFVHFDFEMCFAPQRRAIFHLSSGQMAPHPPLSEPTFWPSWATNHWKNRVFRDFPTFSRICIFFLLTLSLLWSSLFYSSLLSDSSHLCFSSVHIVGSLTSKLPSNID